MEKNEIQKKMWSIAGTEGLKLGLVSAAYTLLTLLMAKLTIPAFINSVVTFLLWVAKFYICIWMMKNAMTKYVADVPEVSNRDTLVLGTCTALLSAFIFASLSFINIEFIFADFYTQQIDTVMQQMAPMMDSNTLNAVDSFMENLPQLTFFSNLIYCFLFGTVLSAILSRNIPSKDPFADYKPQA